MTFNILPGDIREKVGVGTDIITDETIQGLINFVISKVNSDFGLVTTPIKKIKILNQRKDNYLKHTFNKLLKIYDFKIGDENISIDNLDFSLNNNFITFKHDSDYCYFFNSNRDKIKIKFLEGFLEESLETVKDSTSTITSGTNINITLNDVDGLNVGDFVMIQDFEGNKDVSSITNIVTNDITLNEVLIDFTGELLITKLQIPTVLYNYIIYEASIATAINSVGSSYQFNTGYSKGNVSFQKGVPYPHFEKTLNSLIKQRDESYKLLSYKLMYVN